MVVNKIFSKIPRPPYLSTYYSIWLVAGKRINSMMMMMMI